MFKNVKICFRTWWVTSGRGRGRFYKIFLQESMTTKRNVHHKNHPANVKICFSNLWGPIRRGARWILQNACAGVCYYKMHCVCINHPANAKKREHMFSNLVGDIWKGTRSILQNICAGVYYYKMQCASQKPSSKRICF